jgi:putative ubiquitin-RnfH superfamily antitoxin RatB of RatAB toxin-antitoxin module
MALKELIREADRLREERRLLAEQDRRLRERLEAVEGRIREILDASGAAVEALDEQDFQTFLANMSDDLTVRVEVVYARPGDAFLRELQLPRGGTIEDALQVCGVLEAHPEIDLATQKVGVYGKVLPLDHVLRDGDRVEIYRPVEAGKGARKAKA